MFGMLLIVGEALDPSKKEAEKWTDMGLDAFTET